MSAAPRTTKRQQLTDHLLRLIDDDLAPHDRLPTERELAETFEVSRLTVRRALDQLEADGRVYRVQGSGTFVTEPRIAKSVELTSFSEDMRARGFTPGSRLLESTVVPASTRHSYALMISPRDPVVLVRRLRLADEVPMCLETAAFRADLVPGLEEEATSRSLYRTLEQRYNLRLERAEQTIRATVLEPADARLLAVPDFSPALQVERTTFDTRGRAVEHGSSLYRADRYHYELTINR